MVAVDTGLVMGVWGVGGRSGGERGMCLMVCLSMLVMDLNL